MKTNFLKAPLMVCLISLATTIARAQSTYFQAVTNLNPAGYWPMHEVEAAAPGDTETNYGTLGLLGTAYYPDWVVNSGAFIRQFRGALAGDADPALIFTKWVGNLGNGAGVWTNQIYVPHTSPLATLNPPFTVETWVYPIRTNGEGTLSILGQFGYEGLNAGATGGGQPQSGQVAGTQLAYSGPITIYMYAGGIQSAIVSSASVPQTNWYHVVVTCDASTNVTLYTNGVAVGTASAVGKYTPDYWTPMTIGGARGGTRSAHAIVDEFAVYTNVITDVAQHYSDGTNTAPATSYYYDVTNDNPVIYLRMDAPNYTAPAVGTWPALTNYGSAAANGIYTPGTMPGIVTSPIVNPSGVPLGGVSGRLAALSGVSSFADAGSAPAYNPTGSNANFTVTAMFRGNPCDNRIQSIVGHGTNSWQLSMTTNGCLVFNAGNGNKAAGGTGQSAGDISTRKVYNDGNWHQVVAVNSTNVISIYVDGILDTNGTPGGIAVTNIIPGNASDAMIGSDPTYTNSPVGVGRQFAGQICEVAFFTNALTASQVQSLFNASGVAPYITTQPPANRTANGGAGSSISFNVGANGSSLAYQWYFNATSNYGGATKLIDNVVHYTNSTTADVTVTNLTGADSGYYFVVITNSFGATTSMLASLTVNTAPVIISSLPLAYTNLFTLYGGASPAFSVTADGSQPLSFQWFTNGVLDSAATSSNMIWPNVPIGTITNTCIVTNTAGFATNVWIASVVADPTAPYPQQVLALNPIGYWRLNEPDDGTQSADGNAGVIAHDYIGGNDGVYTNAGLGGYYGFLGTPPPYSQTETNTTPAGFGLTVADSDAYGIDGIDFSAPTNTSVAFSIEAWVNGFAQSTDAGIVSKGYGGAEQYDLDTGSDGGTPSHAFRFFVRDAAGNTHIANSSIQPGDVWHHLVGVCDEPNSNVTLYVDGVAVATTTISPNAGILSSSRSMIIGSRPSNSTTNNNDQFVGFVQDVAVYNYALSASQVVAQYVSVGSQPSLSPTPPTSTNVSAGGTLVIRVGAVGTPVLGYTWYDENGGTNVATGTTNGDFLDATLTVSNVPGAWNGDTLQFTVTNAYGTASATVSLIVDTTPQITVDLPPQVTVGSGQSYTYSIGIKASTPQPVFYQWYNAGSQIPGATNSSYIAIAGSPGSTTYYVVVSNSYGTVTSSTSTFTSVSMPPVTGAYATNILGLNPAGYWPMHEVETAAAGDIETNYGTLGLLGTAYYPDWMADLGTVTRQVSGAIAGSDPALHFNYNVGNLPNGAGTWTNEIYLPHTSPLSTLNPPFSVECWLYNANTSSGQLNQSVWGQHGWEGFNAGYAGSGTGASTISGMQLAMNSAGGFTVYGYFNGAQVGILTGTGSMNTWVHVVVTCDASTNFTLYVNGSQQSTASGVGKYTPDYWTPLTIGGTRGGTRSAIISVDEFAVYTNVIGDISTHYSDASVSDSAYFSDVTNDNPVIYLRMDAPAYTQPPENTWPALFNYGSDGIIGVYTPGTVPGIVSGPAFAGLSGTNVAQLSGVSSFADAGFAAAFNPTGSNANFSVAAMFRGNPCDNRVQTIAGHGINSWQLSVTTNGCLVFNAGNGNGGEGTGQNVGDIQTRGVYNDGNWHQVVAINSANVVSIYVDGKLDTNGTPNGINSTSMIPGNANDVLIGSDPSYTNTPAGVGRQFAGQICEVAFFTNALSASQVQQIYNVAIPVIVNTTPTNILFLNSGGQLTLSWPADHIGWQLQSNPVGLTATGSWFTISGSSATNQMIFTPDRSKPNVFYRMLYQP